MLRARCVILVVIAAALGSGCGPSAGQSGGETRAQPGAVQSSSSRNGEVVITGVVSQRYVPEDVHAGKIAGDVGISINAKGNKLCGVMLQFRGDLPPGTYPIGDRLHAGGVALKVTAVVGGCNEGGSLSDDFESTAGTLNLTASGPTLSGSFQFTAGQRKDESKTIQVSGSFRDVPRP